MTLRQAQGNKFLNRETGRIAEDMATEALRKKGYEILERNFANRFGEIDIIARDPSAGSGQATLVFVEVKAKTGSDFGLPEEMINKRKLQKVRNMAAVYMQGQNLPCRLDVVAIVLSSSNELVRLSHYENVY